MATKNFFEQYASAFSKRNVVDIASFYSFPVTFYLEDGTSTLMNESDFYENAKALISIYQGLGMKSVNFRIVSLMQINLSTSLVEIGWSLLDSQGDQLVRFSTRYVMGAQPGGLKILGVLMVDEREKVSAFAEKRGHDNANHGT